MKRSELKRRTPLVAKSPLKLVTPLPRAGLRSVRHGSVPKPPRRVSSPIPAKVRAALLARSGGVCEIAAPGCSGRATDFAHRKKVGAGGRKGQAARAHHVLSNALAACRGCHSSCHSAPAAAYWRGWILREHEIPAEVPALYRGVWVLLTDDGGVTKTNKTPEEAL